MRLQLAAHALNNTYLGDAAIIVDPVDPLPEPTPEPDPAPTP